METRGAIQSVVSTSLSRRRLLGTSLVVGAGVAGVRLSGGNSVAAQATPEAPAVTQYMVNGPDYISAFDWDTKPAVALEVTDTAVTPTELTFEVGIGYEFTITNNGTESHFFTASDFMSQVATRKTETAQTEVKFPVFESIEIKPGQWVEYYFIPVAPGVYEFSSGAADAGTTGTITVTGEAITDPAPVYAPLAEGEWVQDGAALVSAADWTTAETVSVELGESFFKPDVITLKAGMPYNLELKNSGAKKHEFSAVEFYVTAAVNNVDDASGVYKGPMLQTVEVFPASQANLYLIPTIAGEYEVVSEIEDDYELGMVATIVVEAAS